MAKLVARDRAQLVIAAFDAGLVRPRADVKAVKRGREPDCSGTDRNAFAAPPRQRPLSCAAPARPDVPRRRHLRRSRPFLLSLFLSTAVHANPLQVTVLLIASPLSGMLVASVVGLASDRWPSAAGSSSPPPCPASPAAWSTMSVRDYLGPARHGRHRRRVAGCALDPQSFAGPADLERRQPRAPPWASAPCARCSPWHGSVARRSLRSCWTSQVSVSCTGGRPAVCAVAALVAVVSARRRQRAPAEELPEAAKDVPAGPPAAPMGAAADDRRVRHAGADDALRAGAIDEDLRRGDGPPAPPWRSPLMLGLGICTARSPAAPRAACGIAYYAIASPRPTSRPSRRSSTRFSWPRPCAASPTCRTCCPASRAAPRRCTPTRSRWEPPVRPVRFGYRSAFGMGTALLTAGMPPARRHRCHHGPQRHRRMMRDERTPSLHWRRSCSSPTMTTPGRPPHRP